MFGGCVAQKTAAETESFEVLLLVIHRLIMNVLWSILWLLILIFIVWWLANLVAWLYIILLPFVACVPALIPVNDFLLKIIQFPLQCGKNIKDGNDFNEGLKAAETTSTS